MPDLKVYIGIYLLTQHVCQIKLLISFSNYISGSNRKMNDYQTQNSDFLKILFICLAVLGPSCGLWTLSCGMWESGFLIRDLATGPPGKSPEFGFLFNKYFDHIVRCIYHSIHKYVSTCFLSADFTLLPYQRGTFLCTAKITYRYLGLQWMFSVLEIQIQNIRFSLIEV